MAKFRFTLQPVLEQRLAVERQRQVEVARLERHRFELEGRVREAQGQIEAASGRRREALASGDGGRVDLEQLRGHAGEMAWWDRRAREGAVELAGVLKRLSGAREALAEAVRGRRAIERLRERRLEEWRSEMARRERAEADELGIMASGAEERGA